MNLKLAQKLIKIEEEKTFCVEHVLRHWDLSSITFSDSAKKENAAIAFIKKCFDYGIYLGENSFLNNEPFTSVWHNKTNRTEYLSGLLGWDLKLVQKDSIVDFCDKLYSIGYDIENNLSEEVTTLRQDYTKAVECFFEKLSDEFEGILLIKPFGYEDYVSKHSDKDLIYAYEDKILAEINEFEGTLFGNHNLPSRLAISNVGYYDKEQDVLPFLSLIGVLYIQGKISTEYNNTNELQFDLGKLDLNSKLSVDPIFEVEEDSWIGYFYENLKSDTSLELSNIELKLIKERSFKKDQFYTFQEFMNSKNKENIDIVSRKIRLKLKKKNNQK